MEIRSLENLESIEQGRKILVQKVRQAEKIKNAIKIKKARFVGDYVTRIRATIYTVRRV